MPAVDTILLPLCVGLTLLGVIATGVAWRKGNRGRVVQGLALALAPIALFFSGLLRLLWDAVVAVIEWVNKIIFSPGVWFGLSLLALCIVLFVVGGLVHRRTAPPSQKRAKGKKAKGAKEGDRTGSGKAVTGGQTEKVATSNPATSNPAKKPGAPATQADPIDDEMAEIEALLKSRGIE